MKKSTLLYGVACSLGLLLTVACSKDNAESAPVADGSTVTLNIEASYSEDTAIDDTRVEYVDKEGMFWQVSDGAELTVLPAEGGIYRSSAAAIDEETGSATFTAAVPATVRSVHFCYPYADGMALTDRDFDFPGEIVQAAAGRADGIFHLVSTEPAVFEEADVAGGTVDVNPVFEVVGSIVRLLVYSSDTEAQAEQVKSVSLETSSDITGSYRHNFVTGERTVFAAVDNPHSVVLNLTEPYALEGVATADDARGLYLYIIPATTEGYTYTVTTDKHIYTFQTTGSFTFGRNKVHNVLLNLAKATSVMDRDKGIVTYDLSNLPDSKSVTSQACEELQIGYYIASLNGEESLDYSAEFYTNITVTARDENGEPAEWLSGGHTAANWLYVSCEENTGSEERTAYLDLSYTPEEYQIAKNPFATVKITQDGTSTTYSLSYTWFGQTEFTLEGDGDVVDLGYYLAYLDGSSDFVPDSTEEIYGVVEYEVESSEEWLTVRTTGNNHPTAVCFANPSSTEPRTAVVKAYFRGDASKYLLADPDAPIFTLNLTQNAGSGAIDVKTVYYDLSPIGGNLTKQWSEFGVESTDMGWFFAYEVEETGDVRYENGKYFMLLEVSSDQEWAAVTVSGNHLYLMCEKNTDDVRTATITAKYPASDTSVVLRDGGADNVAFTFTVTQASGLPKTVSYSFADGFLYELEHDASAETEWGLRFGTINAYVDGVQNTDTNSVYYKNIVFDCGEDAGWLEGLMAWGSQLYARCSENTTGQTRVGTITMRFAETEGVNVDGGNVIAQLKVTQSAEGAAAVNVVR